MNINRRRFINLTGIIGSGFVLGCPSVSTSSENIENEEYPRDDDYQFSPVLSISSEGTITITVPVPELGQGVRTSLSGLVAEQLRTSLEKVTIVQGVASAKLGGMSAAGSDSIRDYYKMMKKAGAIARMMLEQTAAVKWDVGVNNVMIQDCHAVHKEKNTKIHWKDLFEELKTAKIPANPVFITRNKGNQKWFINPDIENIIRGKAEFGLDVRLENMQYVAVARCPVNKGKIVNFDTTDAEKIKGVQKFIKLAHKIPGGINYAEVESGIAVVADNTWAAIKGREALKIEWDHHVEGVASDEDFWKQEIKVTHQLVEKGDNDQNNSELKLSATYQMPFLTHLCMEPVNFTANVTDSEAYLVGPTQNPRLIQNLVSAMFKITKKNIVVKPTLVGGGFGRKLAIDYAIEAAIISKEAGSPVQVIWTREDDVMHDFFRTASIHKLTAEISNKTIILWRHHIFSKSIGDGPIYEVQGAADLPFNIQNIDIAWGPLKSNLRIGSWRSVAHSYNSYVLNSWIDEISKILKKSFIKTLESLLITSDQEQVVRLPLRGWRGQVPINTARLFTVLKTAVEKAEKKAIQSDQKKRKGRGMAFCVYKGTYTAHVADVSVINSNVTIERIIAVMDCGEIIHHNGTKAQMEGAIMDAITSLFFNEITDINGIVKQNNFDSAQWTRMKHAPGMDIVLIESDHQPTGAGEPPYPSVAPAIANAIFDATGIRIRRLPAKHYGLKII